MSELKSCELCVFYVECIIIAGFKQALKKHIKSFIPNADYPNGPSKEMYKIIGKGCSHYKKIS